MTGAAPSYSLLPTLKNELRRVRTALWFRPTAYCIIAAVLAVFIATIDGFLPRDALAWLPAAESDTVRDLLKLMAGSMLTVATVTLSVLMLVLSLAAGQASPRAVPEVMADPVTQNALGTFLATFVFSLTALLLFGFGAVARPGVTLTFICALLFVMNSLRYLVQWIHHVANALKVNQMIDRIYRQAETVLETYLESAPPEGDEEAAEISGPETALAPTHTGYVQLIDAGKLHELACEFDLSVKLCMQEGDFIHPNRRMMELRGKAPDEAAEKALRSTVVVGFERSHESDPRLGFELLAEIACRAMSPGINDPQTALASIQHLGALLSLAARRGKDDYPAARSSDGRVESRRPDFSALLERALRPVIRDGAGLAEVICDIVRILGDTARVAAPDHLEAILGEAQRAEEMGMAALTLEADKAALGRLLKDLRHFAASRAAA